MRPAACNSGSSFAPAARGEQGPITAFMETVTRVRAPNPVPSSELLVHAASVSTVTGEEGSKSMHS